MQFVVKIASQAKITKNIKNHFFRFQGGLK